MSAAKLELAIVSYDGRVMDVPTSRVLGGESLTIGRGTSNDLTLNDPERLISRNHARLDVTGNNQVTISNVSRSSSLFVNASEVVPGATRALRVSEQVLLGRYLLTLREVDASRIPIARAPVPALFAAERSPSLNHAQATIPDDFDVFAVPPPPTDALTSAASDVLLARDESDAIRGMFDDLPLLDGDALGDIGGLMHPSAALSVGAAEQVDPLAAFMSSTLLDDDRGTASDHGLEINTLFVAPAIAAAIVPPVQVGTHASAPAAIAPAATSTSVRAAEELMDSLLGSGDSAAAEADWLGDAVGEMDSEQPLPANNPIAAPPVQSAPPLPVKAPPPPPRAPAPLRAPAAAPVRTPVSVPSPAPPAVPARSEPAAVATAARVAATTPPLAAAVALPVSTTATHAADLKAAFARGCGIPAETINDFTPENLEALGQIMAALLAGTIRLMHSRSSTKHEMRANVTIITTGGNNPLKFAPDSHSAMVQLLGSGLPGFMPPLRAIDGAFDDLCAHQVGLLAGSRAAMYDMAARLAPERLLEKAGEATGLDAMLASKRKARLWDLYEAGYQGMLGEAREEFEALFQRTFAAAYEQEIERISRRPAS
ncbi:MAG: type VI secretion system-associated FHA domain protein TagH [Dokdonella sp.]